MGEGQWRYCREEMRDTNLEGATQQKHHGSKLSRRSLPPSQGSQMSPAPRRAQAVLLLCAHPQQRPGQDTAGGAGKLLLPQQELGEGKAAGPGCSQISPSIL